MMTKELVVWLTLDGAMSAVAQEMEPAEQTLPNDYWGNSHLPHAASELA